jgi:hypothetical protein
LSDLIRYLEHDSSGALQFSDMGPNWVAVRDGARDGVLSRRDEAVIDVVQRWDQLMRFAALRLGSDIGDDVQEVISKAHRDDPKLRARELLETFCGEGILVGILRVPNAAGAIDIVVDMKARQIVIKTDIDAPSDRGARARVTWLTRQLSNCRPGTALESFSKGARTPEVATLDQVLDDPTLLLVDGKKEPTRFRIVARTEMGANRKGGKKPGFVDTILGSTEQFYGSILQDLTAFQPKAARLEPKPPAFLDAGHQGRPARIEESAVEEATSVAIPSPVVTPTPWQTPRTTEL